MVLIERQWVQNYSAQAMLIVTAVCSSECVFGVIHLPGAAMLTTAGFVFLPLLINFNQKQMVREAKEGRPIW